MAENKKKTSLDKILITINVIIGIIQLIILHKFTVCLWFFISDDEKNYNNLWFGRFISGIDFNNS